MLHYVHRRLIYNRQKLERTQISLNGGTDKEMWYIYTMEYYSAIKNNEFMKFLGKWLDLENIILSEVTSIEGYLGSFQLLAIISKAAMNIMEHVSFLHSGILWVYAQEKYSGVLRKCHVQFSE